MARQSRRHTLLKISQVTSNDMKRFGIFCSALALLITPFAAQAETVLRISDSISLKVDETVEGDFYGAAGPISLSGTVEGDAYVVGGSVTANGVIEEDLFITAGVAQVHATVTDDVRVLGGEVVIAEYVGGDVFVLGGLLSVLSSAKIDGNIFFLRWRRGD